LLGAWEDIFNDILKTTFKTKKKVEESGELVSSNIDQALYYEALLAFGSLFSAGTIFIILFQFRENIVKQEKERVENILISASSCFNYIFKTYDVEYLIDSLIKKVNNTTAKCINFKKIYKILTSECSMNNFLINDGDNFDFIVKNANQLIFDFFKKFQQSLISIVAYLNDPDNTRTTEDKKNIIKMEFSVFLMDKCDILVLREKVIIDLQDKIENCLKKFFKKESKDKRTNQCFLNRFLDDLDNFFKENIRKKLDQEILEYYSNYISEGRGMEKVKKSPEELKRFYNENVAINYLDLISYHIKCLEMITKFNEFSSINKANKIIKKYFSYINQEKYNKAYLILKRKKLVEKREIYKYIIYSYLCNYFRNNEC
jgi:hypothetical protein